MLTQPYVQVSEFRAYPTFIDTLNLRSGSANPTDQDDELREMLFTASSMADQYMEFGENAVTDGTLQAHVHHENDRLRADRYGQFRVHPDQKPVLMVNSFAYGASPSSLQAVTDLSGVWIERGSSFVVPTTAGGAGLTALQFGAPVYDQEMYIQYSVTVGYVNTILGGAVAAGANSIPVEDPTGITGGSTIQAPTVLRIWEPGVEEAVTVAQTYVPGSTTVPLASPLQYAHAADQATGVSSLPPHGHTAVIFFACALLQRPDSEAEDVFPGARREVDTNVGDKAGGSGYIEEAQRLLDGLRRVR